MSRNSIPNPSLGSDALAIISDIHGNLEALVSVLGYIESIGVQRIVCLGDIVGYGPNPVECIRLLRQCETLIIGDWDAAAISSDDPCWSTVLLEQLRWVRDEIAGDESARAAIGTPNNKERCDIFAKPALAAEVLQAVRFPH